MKECCYEECKEIFEDSLGEELFAYLLDSFGNRTRIDYGTGHEMSFVVFLMGIYSVVLYPKELENSSDGETISKDVYRRISHELLAVFSNYYLPLVRKIQTRYRLEPAGSHGAFSLDDFQFLPFYFGSAQLCSSGISTSSFPDRDVAERQSKDSIFFAAISFIHQVKTGPFAEHSNQLWNISAVPEWSKINSGLLKMYIREFLPKFQIVQHLLFGENVLVWRTDDKKPE